MNLSAGIQLFMDSRLGVVSAKTTKINALYLSSLSSFFGTRELDSIALADLRVWRSALAGRQTKYGGNGTRKLRNEPLSPHTLHGYVRAVKQLFTWLHREGMSPSNPAARLEQIQLPTGSAKSMTDADFEKLIAAASGDLPENIRDRAMLHFFGSTGCRLGGAASLVLDDLELGFGRANVTEKARGGGKRRTVYLKREAVRAMHEWLLERDKLAPNTEHVFVTVPNMAGEGGGAPLAKSSIYARFAVLAQRAHVTGRYNPHAVRHRLAKRMLRRGANLAAVSKVMGHSDIRVTHMFYGEYEDGEAHDAHTRYA
jgi:integrase/recombinase XerD